MKIIKDSDASYKNIELKDSTVILGDGSALDSIAFTAFAIDFEERMENETGYEYILVVDEIFKLHNEKLPLTVASMAAHINTLVAKNQKKSLK